MNQSLGNTSLMKQFDFCINCHWHTDAAGSLDDVLKKQFDGHYCLMRDQGFTTKELMDADVFCERVY